MNLNSKRYFDQSNPFTRNPTGGGRTATLAPNQPSPMGISGIGMGHKMAHFAGGGVAQQSNGNMGLPMNQGQAHPGQFLALPQGQGQAVPQQGGISNFNHGIPSGGQMNIPAHGATSAFNPNMVNTAPTYSNAPRNLSPEMGQQYLSSLGVNAPNALQTPNYFANRPGATNTMAAPAPGFTPQQGAVKIWFKDGGSIADFQNPTNFVPGGHVDPSQSDPNIQRARDTVPAFLDKNEFVMDRNSVRGMGNGDIGAGINRFYQLQSHLQNKDKGIGSKMKQKFPTR